MGGGALLPPLSQTVGGHSHPSDVIMPPPPPRAAANFLSHQFMPSISDAGTSHPLDSILGPLPSREEVEKAMADLQCFMELLSAARQELSWLQGVLCDDQSRTIHSSGFGKLYDAFRMLQTEPSVQKMVLSIACDKAVWEAVLNNHAVQDLQGLLSPDKDDEESPSSSPGKLDIVGLIIKWIMDILIQKTGSLVNLILQPVENKDTLTFEFSDLLEEKMRSSFLLSIVLLLIVVVTRIHEK